MLTNASNVIIKLTQLLSSIQVIILQLTTSLHIDYNSPICVMIHRCIIIDQDILPPMSVPSKSTDAVLCNILHSATFFQLVECCNKMSFFAFLKTFNLSSTTS